MKLFKLLFVFVVVFASVSALADQVTPSDRVQSRLRIRHLADGQSAIVGFMLPSETLAWKSSVSGYYEVTLANGDSGFVSKGWARLIPDAVVPAAATTEPRLGSWNVRKLGHGANKDFPRLAQVINEHYDVLAIVEVMQRTGGHPGYDSLVAALGNDWSGIVTARPRPDTTSGSAEFYAILFRPARVHLCTGWTDLRYAPDPSDVFSREPAFACFATTLGNGAAGFDFLLAAYHARWADGDIGDIEGEVQHLNEVFAAMAAARPGEHDLLISGDFNLVPSDLQSTISKPVRTVGTGSTLNGSGDLTDNLYDHLIVSDLAATSEMIAPEEVIDVRNVAASNKSYFDTMSDHLPIVARFRVAADDD